MILVLFFYITDVFAIKKEDLHKGPPSPPERPPSYILEEPYQGPLDSNQVEFPGGDPVYENYGVTNFWWEANTTEWVPWWEKLHVSIPVTPGIRLPPPEINEGNSEPGKETTIETSGGENVTTLTSETSEGAIATVNPVETTSQKETVSQTDTIIVRPEETSIDTSSTTEISLLTTPTAEDQTQTYPALIEIDDANLIAQLRGQRKLAAPQNFGPDKVPNYDYYGELHNEIPPNVKGPEYPGLSQDIPVILTRTDNKTEKRPPAYPNWQLQFPETPPWTETLADGTPKLEKTTFKVNYPDYFDVLNRGMKMEQHPDEGTGTLKPDSSFEAEDSQKSATTGLILRSMDYPGHHVPDSMKNALTAYSPVPFKFDEVAAGKELMALLSKAGAERMMKAPPTLKAVKAISPTYTVPHIETIPIETIAGPYITTSFTYTTEPTTRFTTEPTTTTSFTIEPTTTTRFTTEPTTTTRFTTEPTTTTSVTTTTEPTTTLWVTPTTQPSTTTGYENTIGTTLEPSLLTNYMQTYQFDWNELSTIRSTSIVTEGTTTPHSLIESMKREMANKRVGYFSVAFMKFFEIFSKKENKALTELLRGGSQALENLNKNNDLVDLGPPMWPGTELGFLNMRLSPIERVKAKASIAFLFYKSGAVFNVRDLHRRIDRLFYKKEGEDMLQAVADFYDYPGLHGLAYMNATTVMEHVFKALLAGYLRDKTSPTTQSILNEINENLRTASKKFGGNSRTRRNTQGKSNTYTSTINYNLINKVVNIESISDRSIDSDFDDNDDTSEIPIDNFGGKGTNNANKHKNRIDETNIYDIYDIRDIRTEKIKSVVMIGDSNKKSKKTIDYDNDTYFNKSKAKDKGPGIVNNKDSVTDSGINCYGDECTATDTNAVPKRASRNKYVRNEVRSRDAESKVRLLKDASDETSGQIGHYKETEMGLSVKHTVTEATILYHHNKYSYKNTKKYLKSYKDAKKAFKTSEIEHDNKLLKDNKEKNTFYKNRARSGEQNDKRWYIEIIKYNKSEPKSFHKTNYKFDKNDSKDKINIEPIEYHNEAEIGYSMKQKVTEATNVYHHIIYSNKETTKYPKTYKKATNIRRKSVEDGLSKDIKVTTNYKYNARNVKPSDMKWYLEIFKYNKSEPKTNDEKDKIGYINTKDKIKGKTKYVSGTYDKRPIVQTNGIKRQIISSTKATTKNSDFNHKTTNKTFDYETYDDELEPKLSFKKENKVSSNGKIGISNNKEDDYDTFDDSKDRNEVNHSKTTNIYRKKEPINENAKGKEFKNSAKAKDYIKELRIRRSTKEKEYFRDIKQYYTTTMSSHGEIFENKKIDKKYLTSQNHKTWPNSEKVDRTQTTTTNATENEVLGDENKIKEILIINKIKDLNTPSAKNIKNDNSEGNVSSFENEETNSDNHYNQFDAKESETNDYHDDGDDNLKLTETNVEDTNILEKRYTRLSQNVLPKRFKKKHNPEVQENKKHNPEVQDKKKHSPEVQDNKKHKYYSQSPKPQDVYSEAPDFKQKDLGLRNKKTNILKRSENNKNKSSDYENNKKPWPHSKSQYIINDVAYLKERFRDFNRDNVKTKKSLRNLDKNENILRVESSYSDEEEVLKSNLRDNLLHGGRNFTDTLHKYKKNNPIRDISSYSDEEDTLKKNIYKLFT